MSNTIIAYEKNNTTITAGLINNELDMISIDAHKGIYKVGNVFVGYINKIVKHLNHAYVDIGMEKPCFLQLNDCKKVYTMNTHPDDNLHVGDCVLVQIIKDAVGNKVAGVSTNISISDKYFVLNASEEYSLSFSAKIKDSDFKKAVRNKFKELNIKGFSVLLRTNAYGKDINELCQLLYEYYLSVKKMLDDGTKRTKGSLIYDACPLYLQTIRDADTSFYEKIITDSPEILIRLKDFFKDEADILNKINFYSDKVLPLPSLYDMKKNLCELTKSKIWLKSGAHLVIEHTEALTTIDVNTSKAGDKKTNFSQGYYDINLEAGREIVRQLRLRNISGIIIVDFINMKGDSDIELLKKMEEFARADNKLQVVDITKLGLMELTRKRQSVPVTKLINEYNLCD